MKNLKESLRKMFEHTAEMTGAMGQTFYAVPRWMMDEAYEEYKIAFIEPENDDGKSLTETKSVV